MFDMVQLDLVICDEAKKDFGTYALQYLKFNVNSIFFHCVTDMKIIKDVSYRDTFNINLILWYYGNDVSLV